MNIANTLTPSGVKNAIEIRGLDFFYGTFKGLKGINLDIAEHKVTHLCGAPIVMATLLPPGVVTV